MAIVGFNENYFPEDVKNMSYDETSYYLYGIDIDDKKDKEKE